MKQAIRLAVLPALFVTLAMSTALHAQTDDSGISVHTKTPSANPPASEQVTSQAQPETPAATADPAAADAPAQAENTAPAEAAPEGQQQPEAQMAGTPPANPVGAGSGWDAQFGTAPPQTSRFTGAPEQTEIVEKINAYFNEMTNLEGEFLQTDADNKSKKGKFYIERPGKVLFDYARPSRMKIISNGEYLAIEDHDLNNTNRYPLDSTPFRLLLKERVNLMKDAQIIALDIGDNIVVLTLEDKEAPGGGQIRLFFDWPELQIREWIITDAQGLNTRIQLASLEADKQVDPELFTFSSSVGMPKFGGGSN